MEEVTPAASEGDALGQEVRLRSSSSLPPSALVCLPSLLPSFPASLPPAFPPSFLPSLPSLPSFSPLLSFAIPLSYFFPFPVSLSSLLAPLSLSLRLPGFGRCGPPGSCPGSLAVRSRAPAGRPAMGSGGKRAGGCRAAESRPLPPFSA